MSRGSKKPCPGCGEVRAGRPSNSVCAWCEQKIRDFDSYKTAFDGWQLINMHSLTESGFGSTKEMREATQEFINCFPRGMAPSEIKEGMRKFASAVHKYGRDRYKHGHDNGSSLLRRLAQGDTSLTDFEHHRDAAQRDY